jgi:ribosomal protein L16 Arg81 hydroxylase
MLSEVLDADGRRRFLAESYGKAAVAVPDAAAHAAWLVDWERFGRLALAATPTDVLVVGNGRVHADEAPTSEMSARALLSRGRSVVLRGVDRLDPRLSDLGRALERDLGGAPEIELEAAPAGAHGGGWRCDDQDFFVVQCEGENEYLLRARTLAASPRDGAMACTLERGDWLYVPAGWWHMALARTDSLSIRAGAPTVRSWRTSG